MQRVRIDYAEAGMVTKKNVYGADGRVLLRSGIQISRQYIVRLRELGIGSVYINTPYFEDVVIPDMIGEEIRLWAIRTLQEEFEKVRAEQEIDLHILWDVGKALIDEAIRNRRALFHFIDIRTLEDYLFGHSVNVCVLAILVGMGLEYDEHKLRELAVGALLHDIGEMMLPKEIFNKPGRYTPKEMEVMKYHTALGFQYLRKFRHKVPLLSCHVAFQHHEKFNGGGYPRALKGKDIHEYGRIVAIADVYDALLSDRPYRSAMLPHEAYELMMSGRNTCFDGELLDIFFNNIAIYPQGSVVKLSSGELAVVVQVQQKFPARPLVKVIAGKDGIPLAQQRMIDLTKELTVFIQKVLREDEINRCGLLTLAEHSPDQINPSDGQPSADAPIHQKTDDQSRQNHAGQYRTVTALALDIEQFAAMVAFLPLDDVLDVLEDYLHHVSAMISEHGGYIGYVTGTLIVNWFNVGPEDPDHALHALNAAFEAAESCSTRTFGKAKRELKLRAAIATGQVITGTLYVGEREGHTVVGEVMDQLYDLLMLKQSGILLSEKTCSLLDGQITCTEVDSKTADRTIKAYRPAH